MIQISAANLSLLFVQMVKMGCLKELRILFYRLSKRYKDRKFLHYALYVQVRSMLMLILMLMLIEHLSVCNLLQIVVKHNNAIIDSLDMVGPRIQ